MGGKKTNFQLLKVKSIIALILKSIQLICHKLFIFKIYFYYVMLFTIISINGFQFASSELFVIG